MKNCFTFVLFNLDQLIKLINLKNDQEKHCKIKNIQTVGDMI